MKTTFLKDEYNNLWLFYAQDIKVRHSAAKKGGQAMAVKMDYFNSRTRDFIIQELEDFNVQYAIV